MTGIDQLQENSYKKSFFSSLLAMGKKVIIEDSVWIGANAVVLGGVTVGMGAVIGAGAVVRNDVPAGETVV